MFDLEKAVATWREQMLAAGMQSPAPLEELELHLREEIERQIKSGLEEQAAFNFAVQEIGPGRVLNHEFKKIGTPNIGRQMLQIIGWSIAGYTFCYGVVGLDLHWNLFSFHPKWDMAAAVSFSAILAAETGLWFLAKASDDKTSRIISLLICLFLAWFGLFECLPAEQKIHVHSDGSPMGGFIAAILSDRKVSPFWWRGGLALLALLPLLFWTSREWWRATFQRNPLIQIKTAGK